MLISDFDGVIVDGMQEYWWSARRVALSLLPDGVLLPEALPDQFRQLRPRVLHGWEMGVLAAAIAGWGAPASAFAVDYSEALASSLERLAWSPEQLTSTLDAVRQGAIVDDRSAWLALHRPYPWMLAALQRLDAAGEPWRVLTTKSAGFTAELLGSHGLRPQQIHGREDGPKTEVLLRLRAQGIWRDRVLFLEDRRLTLEAVLATPGLETVDCRLVSWGYLLPEDGRGLPAGLSLLTPEQLEQSLPQQH